MHSAASPLLYAARNNPASKDLPMQIFTKCTSMSDAPQRRMQPLCCDDQ